MTGRMRRCRVRRTVTAGIVAAVLASLRPTRAGGGDAVAGADPAAPAAAGTPLDVFFHGAVVGLDGAKVRLRYDFSSPEHAKDWVDGVPWPIAKAATDGFTVGGGQMAVRGNAGARHVADWEGELSITCRLVPDGVKDIGGFVGVPDSSTDYATYTIGETYFHAWDKKAGGETGMMKFGKQFASGDGKGGYVGFRYLSMRPLPAPPAPGHAVAFGFGRRGEKLWMNVDDLKLDSNDLPPRMKVVRFGFYSIGSSMAVDDVLVEGTLSKTWLDVNRVALRTQKPIVDAAPAAAEVDPAVRTAVAAYKAGSLSAVKVVELLADPSRADVDRAALVEALRSGPKKALTAAIDLLYSADVKVRSAGVDVVKGITGKTYGYDPKAGEKARRAAVGRLQKDIEEHPELTQGG